MSIANQFRSDGVPDCGREHDGADAGGGGRDPEARADEPPDDESYRNPVQDDGQREREAEM